MLSNLRLVLRQNKKFLATFFLVVFLPSLILAYFGIWNYGGLFPYSLFDREERSAGFPSLFARSATGWPLSAVFNSI